MSNLCQYCKVLQFDDSLCGGHMGRSSTNASVLSFADDQIFARVTEKGTKERILRIIYNRQDMLPDLSGLKDSATAGCMFCPFLRRSIQRHFYGRSDYGPSFKGHINVCYVEYTWIQASQESDAPPSCWNMKLKFSLIIQKRKWESITFEICAPQGSLATWLGISQMSPENDGLTSEKASWIKDCISECMTSCCHKQPGDSLPTRLIHVGDRTGNKFGNPRLVITTGQEDLMEDPRKYVTLSYCWGDSAASTLKTEKANLEDHLKEIRLEDMPATCRDAILVARAIYIKWLWIDALCILQDDKDDWEREASRMAEVYANAFLTIVPVTTDSSSQSFLTQRASIDHVDVFFNSVVDPSVQGVFTVRNVSLDMPITDDVGESLFIEIDCSKWVSRGWTFQESLMSFRRLYFGHSVIYFECESMTRTDHGESMQGAAYETGDWVNQIGLDESIGSILTQYWYWNITRYSKRTLTARIDILPAVSAIAKIVSDKIGDRYLGGLWKSDLPMGLSWTTSDGGKLDHQKHIDNISSLKEKDYIGPSWSWTNPCSKGKYIEWPDWIGTPKCEILEAKSVVKGKNPFGCIQSAHILIKGRSRPLPGPKLHHNHLPEVSGQYWTVVEDGYFTAECQLDWYVNECVEDVMEEEQEEDDSKEYPRRYVLTAASASWLNDLVMLLVGQVSEDKTMNGLLLVRAERENEWYRVGVFRGLLGEKEGKDPLQNWKTCTFKLV